MVKVLENKNNMIILKNGDFIDFISYKTHIARFDKTKNILQLNATNWNISQTTLKQLKEFVNYYTTFEYTNKKEFEQKIRNNEKIELIIQF